MAVSRLNLFYAMPHSVQDNPRLLATWIERKVPCFVGGKVPAEWVDRVIADLRQVGVSERNIAAALAVLTAKGIDLAPTKTYTAVVLNTAVGPGTVGTASSATVPRKSSQTSMGPRSYERWDPILKKRKIAEFDLAYQMALTAGDHEAAVRILGALLNLLLETSGGHGEGLQEEDRMKRVRAEILNNAPHVARVVRVLGPLELARLRSPMPTPDNPNNLRFRLPPTTARPARHR